MAWRENTRRQPNGAQYLMVAGAAPRTRSVADVEGLLAENHLARVLDAIDTTLNSILIYPDSFFALIVLDF